MEAQRAQKNELLMYLAHDIKTPLTSLIGYLNYILDHKLTVEDEDKSFQIVEEKSLRLNELLEEFSTILRHDERISELNCDYFSLEKMFYQQLEGFYPLLQKKHLSFSHEIVPGLIIYCDYDKMQRVLENLMRNALNYALKNTEIKFKAYDKDTMLYMEFSNQCEDINEENINHLFDEFYRSSQARGTQSGGAGLGLAIAKEIITLHKGSIRAELEGSTIYFKMELPLEKQYETAI
jgi:two-component system sensor histidine kinase VanS